MSEELKSQSITFNNGSVTGQVGIAGETMIQNMVQSPVSQSTSTTADIVIGLSKIEQIIKSSALPIVDKDAALRHLETTKEEVNREKPNKGFAAESLQRVTEVLRNAKDSANSIQELVGRVKPIIEGLAPWFNVAKSFFGF